MVHVTVDSQANYVNTWYMVLYIVHNAHYNILFEGRFGIYNVMSHSYLYCVLQFHLLVYACVQTCTAA